PAPPTLIAPLLVTFTQAAVFLALIAFVRVLVTEFQEPPQQPPVHESAVADLPAPIKFGTSPTLIGQRGVVTPAGIDLTLSWRADRPIGYPYYLSALVVGPDGQSIPPNVTWQPFDNTYPMTCWRPGSVVTETRHLPL